jgi:hypothetical protein
MIWCRAEAVAEKKSFGKIIFFNREDRNQGVQSKNSPAQMSLENMCHGGYEQNYCDEH